MEFNIGRFVRKVESRNDIYIVTHTKEDKKIHPMLKDNLDYLIQKKWDFFTKANAEDAPLEAVFESAIYAA